MLQSLGSEVPGVRYPWNGDKMVGKAGNLQPFLPPVSDQYVNLCVCKMHTLPLLIKCFMDELDFAPGLSRGLILQTDLLSSTGSIFIRVKLYTAKSVLAGKVNKMDSSKFSWVLVRRESKCGGPFLFGQNGGTRVIFFLLENISFN